jgi:NAD(P)-dependent dehydrogenase (short-subunit alcohol dehydrogenase family)
VSGVADRVIAITGAGGGLGREYALLLASNGAKVIVNDLGGARDGSGSGHSMADAVVAEIVGAGGIAVANYDDASSSAGGPAVVQTALDAFGRIDGIVANAGILRDGTFHKMTAENWEAVIRVHVHGAFHVIRAAWPLMREQAYGRVVVATSTSGIFGNFGQANYGAAKSALIGLINTLSREGGRHGILANAIAPVAATRMTEGTAPADVLAALGPAHVAPIVGYLLSDECNESGSVIFSAGGEVRRMAYFQSHGVTFDAPPSIGEVAAAWSAIVSMDDAVPAVNPAD